MNATKNNFELQHTNAHDWKSGSCDNVQSRQLPLNIWNQFRSTICSSCRSKDIRSFHSIFPPFLPLFLRRHSIFVFFGLVGGNFFLGRNIAKICLLGKGKQGTQNAPQRNDFSVSFYNRPIRSVGLSRRSAVWHRLRDQQRLPPIDGVQPLLPRPVLRRPWLRQPRLSGQHRLLSERQLHGVH
jgi:hypothetical protein